MFSREQIKKFQDIYKETFGVEISQEEAYEKGVSLIQLMRLTYKPMTLREYRNLQKRRKATKNL
jgi:hypothetical protein